MSSDTCARCGFAGAAHYGLNHSDGPQVSGTVLVCPTATFQLREHRSQPHTFVPQTPVCALDHHDAIHAAQMGARYWQQRAHELEALLHVGRQDEPAKTKESE